MLLAVALALPLYYGLRALAGAVSPALLAVTTTVYAPIVIGESIPKVSTTETSTVTATGTSTATATATATSTPTATATATSTPTPTSTISEPTTTISPDKGLLEGFETSVANWRLVTDGEVTRSNIHAASGETSARTVSNGTSQVAQVRVSFSDAFADHQWQERPGTYHWQRVSIYLPSSTVAQIHSNEYLTLGGLWASQAGYGWYLRVRQGGELYVVGQRSYDNIPVEFRVYGVFPQDRWVEVEIGLHSQHGPGVGRAFAFLINGAFYGWYHQGRMSDEVYDRAAFGMLSTNSAGSLELFIDNWRTMTSEAFPGGPDTRQTTTLQEQDYRTMSGIQWQIDWSTWDQDLHLDSVLGLYTASSRLQSGRNIDRMPDLTNGWAEIEVDWVGSGVGPGDSPGGAFAGMVGFHKEINREQNLEIAPVLDQDGRVRIYYDAWTSGANVFAKWELPNATTASGNRNIPEPGDILQVRWEKVNATDMHVQVNYYDASTTTWYRNIIDDTRNLSAVANASGEPAVNFLDGYHQAASLTIDSSRYSIRRFKVGTLDTYRQP